MAVPKLHCQKRILVNFTVETATSFFIPTTLVRGKKIISCALGLERTALRLVSLGFISRKSNYYKVYALTCNVVVRSHIGWRGERTIPYKGVETSH